MQINSESKRHIGLNLPNQALGGIVLVVATVAALLWVNLLDAGSYRRLWGWDPHVQPGLVDLPHSLGHWITDGLMAFFFLMVGLEIKREIRAGELANRSQAMLPIFAAVGGVVVPALIYLAFNAGTAGERGWAIPMATDIAFALGVLALLGNRVPVALTIFLTALAIVDDIIAVLVIAVFYSSGIEWLALGIAAAIVALLLVLGRMGVHHIAPYIAGGVVLWLAVLESGVHATIAGVLLAFVIPWPRVTWLEHLLRPWCTFLILPLFALANAGVVISNVSDMVTDRLTLGIVTGLVLGKPIGITLFSVAAVRLGLATLPRGVGWAQIRGAGALAGIGFTVSLFVTELAFEGGDDPRGAAARLGILLASVVAGLVGATMVYRSTRPVRS